MLVASTLGDGEPGLFALDGDEVVRIDRLAGTGVAVDDGGTTMARLFFPHESTTEIAGLALFDADGLALYRRLHDVVEPHTALWHDDLLAVVSTGDNSIAWLDASGAVRRRWRAPGEGDCWHLNTVLVHAGRLIACAFGRFASHRAWSAPGARDEAGVVFDVETGEDLLTGLSAPHDPTPVDGGWLVNNSQTGELVRFDERGSAVQRRQIGPWPRGLALDDEHVYVGASAHRLAHDPGACAIVTLDRRTLAERSRVPLPCTEVFSLTWAPRALVQAAASASPSLVSRPGC